MPPSRRNIAFRREELRCFLSTSPGGRRPAPRSDELGHSQIVMLQRERSDALASRREDCIEHRRCGDADCRLANATPKASGWHDDALDLRHLRDAHGIVAIEVRLLDATILDRALLIEQGRKAVDEGACDLPFDLGWVDRMTRVGGGDDAMDLDGALVAHRDLRARCHVAAIAHVLGDPTEDPLRRRVVPPRLFSDCIEHGAMLGMIGHQLAAELQRILANRMRKLIHETFEVDGVVVDIHATPEARRDRWIAHGMVDQKVRNGVTERRLASWIEARERSWVLSIFESSRKYCREDRLTRDAHL